ATEVPSRCTEIEEPQPGREGEDAAAQEVVRRPRDLLPDVFVGAGGIAASSLGDEPLRQGTCGRSDSDAPPRTLSPSPSGPEASGGACTRCDRRGPRSRARASAIRRAGAPRG